MSQFSKTSLLIGAAAMVGTVEALVMAAVAQGVAQIVMMVVYLKRRFPQFWHAFDRTLLRAQATYALPLGASSLLVKLQDDLHHAFVSNAFGPAVYALYSVGVFKLPLVGILRESVGSVVLPRINHLETLNERRQILVLVANAARKLALVYYPIYVFLMVTGPDVIAVLFTRQYADAWPVFAVSLTILPFGVIVMDPVTRAHDERYFFLRLRLLLFATSTTVLALWSRELGLVGVIGAVVTAYLAGWCVSAIRMGRLLGMTRSDPRLFADLAWIGGAAGLAGVGAALVRADLSGLPPFVSILACGAAFAPVYVGAVLLARVVRPGEVRTLWRDARLAGRRPPRPVPVATTGPPQPQTSVTPTG
jgi:O-antigen/teichoic acid export membrane protein